MEIKKITGLTFLIKGKKESVLLNPDKERLEKNNCRIVVYNQPKYDELRTVGDRVSIMGPGEYEIGGVEINGFAGGKGNTIYTILVDGVTIGFVGKLDETLSDKRSDKITGIDVLLADVQNGYKAVSVLAKKWGANYIVPMDGTDGELSKFLDEADCEGQEKVDSLKIDKDNLPDGTEVVVLK